MKSILLIAANFLLVGWAHAGEVQCSVAYSDDTLIRVVYQVDSAGNATSPAQLQYFSQNGFTAKVSLDIVKSTIDSATDTIHLTAGTGGNTINFDATVKGGFDAYSGVAHGSLKDQPFDRLIVCTLR